MDDYKYLDCYTGDIENGKLYVVSVLFGIVLEYDLKDFSYKVLTQINLPDPFQMVRVNSIVKEEHFLYMTLFNSWNVFVYDIRNRQMKVYGNNFEYIDGKNLIQKSYLYHDKIWLFPYDISQKIRIFYLETKEFEINVSVEEILDQKGYQVQKGSLISLDVVQEKNKCILAVYNSPYIIEMNLETERFDIYEIKSNAHIEVMSYVDGQYWFSYTDNRIIERWSLADGILETYESDNKNVQEAWKYRFVFPYKEKIIIASLQDKIVYIIDKKSRQKKVLEYSKEIQKVHNRERWMFQGFIEYNDKIILLPYSLTDFIVIDLQNERLESYSGKFGADVINKYWIKPRLPEWPLLENAVFDFSKYLDFISEYNLDIENHVSRIGEKIWIHQR